MAHPAAVFVVGFVLASTGAAYGFWTTSGTGSGQAQAVTLNSPGTGSATSPTTTSLQISWGVAPGLPAGGGYKVLRGTTDGGPYAAISGGSCNQTITVTSSATSCTDDDPPLVPGTTYYYVVEAVYDDVTTTWTSPPTAQFPGATSPDTLSITTRANPSSVAVGGSVEDQATFAGLVNPATSTGTITWRLYAASDTNCTGMVSFTSSPQKVTANTTYTSSSFTTTSVGTYKWGFTYTGDASNHPVTTCGGVNELLTVNPATSHVTTSADPATTTVGGSVADQASFTGLVNPASSSGTVSWALYRSTDTFCSGTPVFTSAPQKVTANTTYTSSSFTTTSAGSYKWAFAYTGDTRNAAQSGCGGTNENLTVGYGAKVIDLFSEVQAYNATHVSNGVSAGPPDFAFFSTASTSSGCQGGSVNWTGSAGLGTMQIMNVYTATSSSNGKWSNATIGSANGMGPYASTPFNGVRAQPHPTNGSGRGGVAALVRLTVPGPPTGSYQPGATIKVQAAWISGSSVYVYVLDGAGKVVAGTNPMQVRSGRSMSVTFSISTPSAGADYYVAVAPTDSTSTAVTLDMTASLPFG